MEETKKNHATRDQLDSLAILQPRLRHNCWRACFMATAVKRKKSNPRKNESKKPVRKWSARVMQTSDALDLDACIFKLNDPNKIARSLKRSAEKSKRKKGTPFQSAMSMLNFYINRAGKILSLRQKNILEKSTVSLREVFHRPAK